MLQIIQDNSSIILGALLAISELLGLIPALKSNGILSLVVNLLKSLAGKKA